MYPVIIRDPRTALPAKLIHKGNEVIGRDLEFGIRTMARERDGDARRKRETMMKENVEIEEDRKKKRREKRTGQQ